MTTELAISLAVPAFCVALLIVGGVVDVVSHVRRRGRSR